MMDVKMIRILDDYIDCGRKHFCDECLAHNYINETKTTFCEMLSEYRGRLQNKINEVIEAY